MSFDGQTCMNLNEGYYVTYDGISAVFN